MTTFRITYKPPGPVGPSVTEVAADWWDLETHTWFHFYRNPQQSDLESESEATLILSVSADTVVSIQRMDD